MQFTRTTLIARLQENGADNWQQVLAALNDGDYLKLIGCTDQNVVEEATEYAVRQIDAPTGEQSMNEIINDAGKPIWKGVDESSAFSADMFHVVVDGMLEEDFQWALHTDIGSITVLDRLTGFGWRDTETGFRDQDGDFWLASGGLDVRNSGCETIGDAIQWVKDRANTCTGPESKT